MTLLTDSVVRGANIIFLKEAGGRSESLEDWLAGNSVRRSVLPGAALGY